MEATIIIRDAVARVAQLRQSAAEAPGLAQAVSAIKHFQARRFAATYFDLLQSEQYRPAALFFLQELYSAKDYSQRDAQFARIAAGLERVFPKQVVQTAVSLAQLHRLTEELDLAMARYWMTDATSSEVVRYVAAWRAVGRRADRATQLEAVLSVGQELDHLTRTPGLRLMLKMMRGPARLMEMEALQRFLEAGFDTFAAMGRQGAGAAYFLDTVRERESGLAECLFSASAVAGETEITRTLGQSR